VASEPESTFQNADTVIATSKTIGGGQNTATYYNAELTSLTPGTTYNYRTGKPGRWSEVKSFTTAPAKPEDYTFLFMGDVQRDINTAEVEYPQWGQLLKKAYDTNPDIKFGLMAGDMVQSGSDLNDWKHFLSYGQIAFSNIPMMPTIGNHESNFEGGKPNYYLDIFDLPKNGPEGYKEEFYSYDYGAVHYTVLNSWVLSQEQGIYNNAGTLVKP
jgi:hypothetical protein